MITENDGSKQEASSSALAGSAPAVGFTITRLGRRIEVVDVSERFVWFLYYDGRSGTKTLNCPRAEWTDKLARTVAIAGTLVE